LAFPNLGWSVIPGTPATCIERRLPSSAEMAAPPAATITTATARGIPPPRLPGPRDNLVRRRLQAIVHGLGHAGRPLLQRVDRVPHRPHSLCFALATGVTNPSPVGSKAYLAQKRRERDL